MVFGHFGPVIVLPSYCLLGVIKDDKLLVQALYLYVPLLFIPYYSEDVHLYTLKINIRFSSLAEGGLHLLLGCRIAVPSLKVFVSLKATSLPRGFVVFSSSRGFGKQVFLYSLGWRT